jgi:hypothetical protein
VSSPKKKSKKPRIARIRIYNHNDANRILEKTKSNPDNALQKYEKINLVQIIKLVESVVSQAKTNEHGFRIPLHVATYDQLMTLTGFKPVAEKKLKIVLSYIARHRDESHKLRLLS